MAYFRCLAKQTGGSGSETDSILDAVFDKWEMQVVEPTADIMIMQTPGTAIAQHSLGQVPDVVFIAGTDTTGAGNVLYHGDFMYCKTATQGRLNFADYIKDGVISSNSNFRTDADDTEIRVRRLSVEKFIRKGDKIMVLCGLIKGGYHNYI